VPFGHLVLKNKSPHQRAFFILYFIFATICSSPISQRISTAQFSPNIDNNNLNIIFPKYFFIYWVDLSYVSCDSFDQYL